MWGIRCGICWCGAACSVPAKRRGPCTAGLKIEPHLTEEERDVLRRGQNAHAKHAVPKNQSPEDYSRATGLEALMGYLYLSGQMERIGELFDIAGAIH